MGEGLDLFCGATKDRTGEAEKEWTEHHTGQKLLATRTAHNGSTPIRDTQEEAAERQLLHLERAEPLLFTEVQSRAIPP